MKKAVTEQLEEIRTLWHLGKETVLVVRFVMVTQTFICYAYALAGGVRC